MLPTVATATSATGAVPPETRRATKVTSEAPGRTVADRRADQNMPA
ncbi:hypothetical protein [Aureimonas psammosilenae]